MAVPTLSHDLPPPTSARTPATTPATPGPAGPLPTAASGRPRRLLLLGLAIAWGVLAIAYMNASLFSHFAAHDDEGWMMTVLRHFLDGGAMYDSIPNVYGPFTYLFQWLIYGAGGVPLTTDAVRFVTMGHWIGAVGLTGACVWLLTRQVGVVALTLAGVLFHLTTIRNEPLHPQELCALLFAGFAAAAASAKPGRTTLALAIGGAIASALVLVKLNVGVFASLAWIASFLFAFDLGKPWRLARLGTSLAAVALPVVLMRGNLHDPATGRLAFVMALSTVCLLICQRHRELQRELPRGWVVGLGIALPLLVACAFVFARGTTPHGLWEGVVMRASRFTGSFLMPIQSSWRSAALVSVVPLVLWAATTRAAGGREGGETWRTPLVVVLKAAIGALVFAAVFEGQRSGRWWSADGLLVRSVTPLLGVALLPPFAAPVRSPLARLSLCWFALLEVLVVYPVAGTQRSTGTLLFLPIAAVCLGDVIHWSRSRPGTGPAAAWAERVGVPMLLTAILAFTLVEVRLARRRYAAGTSLDLPGARLVRVDEHQAAVARWLTANLALHSDTFLSNVGLNSLYFWTGKPTPSVVTLSTVVEVYSDADQHDLMTALASHRRSFFVYHAPLFRNLARTDPSAPEPRLIREMQAAYEDRGGVNGFRILSLKTQPSPLLVDCCEWRDRRSFSVSIAPRPGQFLSTLTLHDLDSGREIPLAGFTTEDAPAPDGPARPEAGGGPPFDLSAARQFVVTLPEELVVSGRRLLCRLHDADGRHFGSLPFLDPPVPLPVSVTVAPHAPHRSPADRAARRVGFVHAGTTGRGRSHTITQSPMQTPARSTKRVAIVQSNYVPWKGYFDMIRQVDEFILLDGVQYTRRDWRNRNRIKTPRGTAWLTIPVKVTGRYLQSIRETEISDAGWAENHWRRLESAYARAPHFAAHAPRLEALYRAAARRRLLCDVNRMFLEEVCAMLGIATRLSVDSDYHAEGTKTERLVALCRAAGATDYLSGPAARDYLDPARFDDAGIGLSWMDYAGYPEYPQLHPPFDHAVSVLDLLFHTGHEAARYLERGPAT